MLYILHHSFIAGLLRDSLRLYTLEQIQRCQKTLDRPYNRSKKELSDIEEVGCFLFLCLAKFCAREICIRTKHARLGRETTADNIDGNYFCMIKGCFSRKN